MHWEEQFREILSRYLKGECTPQETRWLEEWFEQVGDRQPDAKKTDDGTGEGVDTAGTGSNEKRTGSNAKSANANEEGTSGNEKGADDEEKDLANALLSAADEERLIHLWRQAIGAAEKGPLPATIGAVTNKPVVNGIATTEAEELPRIGLRRRIRYAAIWTGLILLGGWVSIRLYKRHASENVARENAFLEVSTGYGEVRKVLLPDSSIVWLNSATHLLYHPDFAAHRELQLRGEAFFEVKSDVQHPFVVKSGIASTQVFGTAFNVSAYEGAGQLRVSLQSGRVGVYYDGEGGRKQQLLSPGQLLIYDKEDRAARVEIQEPGEMDVWKNGKLIFFKTPVKEALAQIEARYGVHIVYDRNVKEQSITATFENAALEKVLEHLSFGWDLHFARHNDTLHVK